MVKENFIKSLKLSDLPQHYREVADVIGLENMIKLAEAFHGVQLYFKHPDRILYPAKVAYILDNFTGNNRRELALETGLTLKTVYQIIQNDLDAAQQWQQDELL